MHVSRHRCRHFVFEKSDFREQQDVDYEAGHAHEPEDPVELEGHPVLFSADLPDADVKVDRLTARRDDKRRLRNHAEAEHPQIEEPIQFDSVIFGPFFGQWLKKS